MKLKMKKVSFLEQRKWRMEFENKVQRCKDCYLSEYEFNKFQPEKLCGKLLPRGNCINPKIFFVGIAPGATRRLDLVPKGLRVFIGGACLKFTQLADSYGLEKKYYCTNLIKCSLPGNRVPKQTELEACPFYLLKEIEHYKPTYIFALGQVLHRFFEVSQHVMAWKNFGEHKALVIGTYHPDFIYSYMRKGEEPFRVLLNMVAKELGVK